MDHVVARAIAKARKRLLKRARRSFGYATSQATREAGRVA